LRLLRHSPNILLGVTVIVIEDILSVRYRAPDLDLMEEFLRDFGLRRVARTSELLYVSGEGLDPVVHVTEKGDSGSIGFSLKARSRDDLESISLAYQSPVMDREEPGGGRLVRIRDPDGNQIDIVHGFASQSSTPLRRQALRENNPIRGALQPSQVLRLGHVALHIPNFAPMRRFYMDVLGMRVSDSYHVEHPENPVASFLHCGLGQQFVDHHTVALFGDGRTGFEHAAFEVTDIDELMRGNAFLKSRNRWKHSWGIGRHIEGSQLFDYWRDPFGNKIEHWADGDRVNDDYKSGSVQFNPASSLSQWGPPVNPEFLE
jgi:catechol 2,3-dioxygenase-like lactoylglutathione lyase family enzyme